MLARLHDTAQHDVAKVGWLARAVNRGAPTLAPLIGHKPGRAELMELHDRTQNEGHRCDGTGTAAEHPVSMPAASPVGAVLALRPAVFNAALAIVIATRFRGLISRASGAWTISAASGKSAPGLFRAPINAL